MLTLKEVNYKVEKDTNELNKLLKDKEILECMVDPKSTDYTKVIIDGGMHANILDIYVAKKDLDKWKNLDRDIQILQKQIKNNMDWIDNELKILNKYDKTEQLVVYFKEDCHNKYTWHQISAKVGYSVSQCKRIYKKFTKQRLTKN